MLLDYQVFCSGDIIERMKFCRLKCYVKWINLDAILRMLENASVRMCFYVLGVEALVGWLLDHPDVQITDLSDADTVSDEYSDEEITEEVEEAEAACPVVSIIFIKAKSC